MNESDIRQSLETIECPHLLVIGDLMLDHYSWGEVDRISPEAPIPVSYTHLTLPTICSV